MKKISFSYFFPFQTKMKTATVHPNWFRIIGSKGVWSDFIVHDTFMTTSRYNFAGKFYDVSYIRMLQSTLILGWGKYRNIARCDILISISQYRDIGSAIFAIFRYREKERKFNKKYTFFGILNTFPYSEISNIGFEVLIL